jgi:Flp pilus assembly secretin CpaC
VNYGKLFKNTKPTQPTQPTQRIKKTNDMMEISNNTIDKIITFDATKKDFKSWSEFFHTNGYIILN